MTAAAADPRRAGALLLGAALLVYAAGFFLWPPRALQISDEASYVGEAQALAHGHLRVPALDPQTLSWARALPSTYPPGTSLLQAPFVFAFGPRFAALASLCALVACALLLGRLLWRRGEDPLFALGFVGFLPALVLGRAAMSDLPAALLVTCALYPLLAPRAPGARGLFASGLCAGLSLLLRESNAVFVLPLCLGVLLRRERGAWALLAGAALGVAAKLWVTRAFFGDPLYTRFAHSFSLETFAAQAPFYLFALLVLAPGGLLFGLGWRGARRPEVLATVLLSFAFFAAYDYSGEESGLLRRLVLGPRFFLPLVPLLVLSAAARLGPRLREGPLRRLGLAAGAAVVACAGLVHPLYAARGAAQAAESAQVCAVTAPGAVLVGNSVRVGKVAGDLSCPRPLLERARLAPERLSLLAARFAEVDLVLLDRDATAYDRDESRRNADFLEAVALRCTLAPVLDRSFDAERLRVLRATACK